MLNQVDNSPSIIIHDSFCDPQIVNCKVMAVVVRACEITFGIGSHKVCSWLSAL